MVAAAMTGGGVALAPVAMFGRELAAEQLVRPFDVEISMGSYWLIRLMSRPDNSPMLAFREWLAQIIETEAEVMHS
jgi:LysR family transcriptional regulator of beta-lactamase